MMECRNYDNLYSQPNKVPMSFIPHGLEYQKFIVEISNKGSQCSVSCSLPCLRTPVVPGAAAVCPDAQIIELLVYNLYLVFQL